MQETASAPSPRARCRRFPAANVSASGWRWPWRRSPQVLLLDEPTTFLDLNHQMEVLELVRYLNREHGLTVVMVLHDLNQAARYAGRVVVLKDGAVYGEGAPEAIITPQTLRDVFGVEGHILPGPDGSSMVVVPIGRV